MLKILMAVIIVVPTVTAETVSKEFKENEITAEEKYKKQEYIITGVVKSVSKGTEEGTAEVCTESLIYIVVPLKANKKVLVALKAGDKISCKCRFSSNLISPEFKGKEIKNVK